MTETGIVAMAGIVTTLLSGLGSSFLTNRYGAKRDRERLRFEVQIALRQLIVDTLIQSRQWIKDVASVADVIMTEKDSKVQYEYVSGGMYESVAGQQLEALVNGLQSNITEAQLLVADGQFFSALDDLRTLQEKWLGACLGAIPDDFEPQRPDRIRRSLKWHTYTQEVHEAISRLETVTRFHISVSISRRVGPLGRQTAVRKPSWALEFRPGFSSGRPRRRGAVGL